MRHAQASTVATATVEMHAALSSGIKKPSEPLAERPTERHSEVRIPHVAAPVGWSVQDAMRATGILEEESCEETHDPLFDDIYPNQNTQALSSPHTLTAPTSAIPPAQPAMVSTGMVSGFGSSFGTPQGMIPLPGIPGGGLSPNEYIPLMHLYALTQDADRFLEYHYEALRDASVTEKQPGRRILQGCLTPLDGSTQHANLWYKREDLTASRAYKLRGAFVGMGRVLQSNPHSGILAVSTGNHALGVLYAASLLKPKRVNIVVPHNTLEKKLAGIRQRVTDCQNLGIDAQVTLQGETFDDAKRWALQQADADHNQDYYLDPYGNPWVVSGQGTIGLELYRQIKHVLTTTSNIKRVSIVCPIGGGGLLAGIATAFRLATAWDSHLQQVSVQFVGIRLEDLTASYGDAIKVKVVASGNQRLFERFGIPIVNVTNTHLMAGMLGVYLDLGDQVEGSSGVTHQVTMSRSELLPTEEHLVVCILSGGNVGSFPCETSPPA